MKIVLDTTVFISGLLRPHAAPGTVLRLVLDAQVDILLDGRILLEYEEVASRAKFGIARRELAVVLKQVRARAVMVVPRPLDLPLPDPDDLPFPEVARTAQADAIVTGNKKHFPHKSPRGIPVCTPRQLLEKLAQER